MSYESSESYKTFKEGILSLCGSGMVEYAENVMLADISTFKIGGKCRLVVYPKSSYALRRVLLLAKESSVDFAVFGRCSNILFSDDGWHGVLIITSKMFSISRRENRISAECGVRVGDMAKYAQKAALSGCEFMYGIPGTLGGAVYMNAGAYEHSVSDVIVSASYLSLDDMNVYKLEKEEMQLSYRESVFAHNKNMIITEATFELEKKDPDEIKATMDDYMSRRRRKQPLDYPSAGSVFRRPEGYFAGKLIEDCGLKGKMYGGAMISVKHAGFIVNNDNAKASDVLYLIDLVKRSVMEKFGVEMKTEIIFFGDTSEDE